MRVSTGFQGLCGAALAAGLLLSGGVAGRAQLRGSRALDDQAFTNLSGGTYTSQISGLLCEACAHAIQKSIAGIPGVEKVAVDFAKRRLTLTIKPDWRVRVATIRGALHEASRRIDLGTEFKLVKLSYVP